MNNLVIKFKDVEHAIEVRESDGYLNATQLCKVGDKLFANYMQNKTSDEYHKYLVSHIGKPIGELIVNKPGSHTGSWVQYTKST